MGKDVNRQGINGQDVNSNGPMGKMLSKGRFSEDGTVSRRRFV